MVSPSSNFLVKPEHHPLPLLCDLAVRRKIRYSSLPHWCWTWPGDLFRPVRCEWKSQGLKRQCVCYILWCFFDFPQEHCVSGSCCSKETIESHGTNVNPAQSWSQPQLNCRAAPAKAQIYKWRKQMLVGSHWVLKWFVRHHQCDSSWWIHHITLNPRKEGYAEQNIRLEKLEDLGPGAVSCSEKSTSCQGAILIWHGSGKASPDWWEDQRGGQRECFWMHIQFLDRLRTSHMPSGRWEQVYVD